jgi:hypothetical protein
VIRSNYETRRVEFYEKQGILEKRELGQIDPADPVDVKKTKSIINRFVGEYEKFKSANWGGGEGFIGFGNIMPR